MRVISKTMVINVVSSGRKIAQKRALPPDANVLRFSSFRSLLKASVALQHALTDLIHEPLGGLLEGQGSLSQAFVGGVGPSFIGWSEDAAHLEGEVAVVADIPEAVHDGVKIHGAQEGEEVGVGVSQVILDVQGADVAPQKAQLLVLGHLLEIGVARVPDGVEKGVIHQLDEAQKVGGVVDPVEAGDTHSVEVLHQDVDAVPLRPLQDGGVERLVGGHGLVHRKAGGIPRVDHQVGDAPGTAGVYTADGIGDKPTAVIGQGASHGGVGLNQPYAQLVGGAVDLLKVGFIVLGEGPYAVGVVTAEAVVCVAEACLADVAETLGPVMGIAEKIARGGCQLHGIFLAFLGVVWGSKGRERFSSEQSLCESRWLLDRVRAMGSTRMTRGCVFPSAAFFPILSR